MSTFIWQSHDGDFDNPESWGIAPIVNGVDASTAAADATVSLPGATDLSGVSVGDTLKLVNNAEGKNSGQYYEITAVNDGADTVEVSPTPASNDANIVWVISEALPGANAATDDIHFPGISQVGVTSGLDQTTQGKFTTIVTFPEYVGKIGLVNTPLNIGVTALYHEGSAPFHFQSNATTTRATFNSRSLAASTTRGTITSLIVSSSNVRIISAGAGILYVTEEIEAGQSARVVVDVGGALGDLWQNAGFVSVADSIGNCYISGGKLVVEAFSNGGITNLYQGGGHVIYNSTTTLALAVILAGFLDFYRDARDKTITQLYVFPGAVAEIPDHVNVTGGPLGGLRYS